MSLPIVKQTKTFDYTHKIGPSYETISINKDNSNDHA